MKKNKKIILIILVISLFSIFIVDNVLAETYNNYSKMTLSCGFGNFSIPANIPRVTKIIYKIIQIAVPVVLVIFGSIDLLKAVMGGNEDEIKKGRQIFIKRVIAAALVFFVVAIVKFIVSVVADSSNSDSIITCLNTFIGK